MVAPIHDEGALYTQLTKRPRQNLPIKKNYARKGMKFLGTLNFLPCLLRNKPPVRVCVCPWWQSPFLNTKQISHWNRRRLNDH